VRDKTGDATIVSAMIGMGNSLKLRVGTKGVGTREQLAFL
jgi:EAL domain-containing protein (putative c-di-GMP-specific phosphodiesterase class I)